MTGRHAGSVVLADGTTVIENLYVADTWWSRFRGLQFLPELAHGTGLLLTPCRSVHTFWMRFSIHLLFLNSASQIVEIRRSASPWRAVLPTAADVSAILEVPVSTSLPPEGTILMRPTANGSPAPILEGFLS